MSASLLPPAPGIPVADAVTLEALNRDPWPVVAALRDEAPVHWVPALNRYLVMGFDDCRFVETRPDIFTAVEDRHPVDRTIGRSMIRKDDPNHAPERHAANRALRIKVVADRWRPVFEENTRVFLDQLIAAGPGADLSADFAAPLAASNVAALVGLKDVPATVVLRWSTAFMAGAADPGADVSIRRRVREANAEIDDVIASVVAGSNRAPDGTILAAMIDAGMSLETQRANVKLAISGGINEPKHALTNAVWALARHREQHDRAVADPTLFEAVFEEIVRWLPPVGVISRRTTCEVEIAGVTIPEGAQIGACLHSANRDPRRFTAPDAFDIDRDSVGHLAFGAGPHMCAGRWAAQCAVGQVALPQLYARFSGLRPVDSEGAAFAGWTFRGLETLPVTWDAVRTPRATGAVVPLEVTVVDKSIAAEGVCAVTLRPNSATGPLPWQPGAHLTVEFPTSDDASVERQYSLCGSPDEPDYRIAVRREEAGRGGSDYVHSRLAVGDRIRISPPRNNFVLYPAQRYRFVAGGIGITPIVPMIAEAHRRGVDWSLLYLGRARRGMPFLDWLSAFGDRVTVWPSAELGRVRLADHLSDVAGELVYACGPGALLDELEELSQQWPADTLHVERFAARVSDLPNKDFRLNLARSGIVLDVAAEQTIVDALQSAGIEVATSCLEGTCRTCETTVVAGTPCHRDSALTEAERQRSMTMMICVSRSQTSELTLDL
ncbi:cytochrome P450 [Gordonia jacobaea]|uniref:cytochrome P450/oxidoreductase n=1 Tax=Gordonia jacobaea TaxID=122202 RepID=UPI0022E6D0B6|nr:cytochrome P450 [Gordonia jacobaea]